ncbi:nuclear export mediator factor Nemf-like [Planoprotostelium fungivorum]|uniref:Nuclear export mediator factor Nemf-like n=1 Tax=Planoprotostelium fungivorum TaxID=1890364 RepID=A0A2P6NQF7_9EUKA|nr:nuclear export mediator factor Nemf-like [Planoprotostelium fungivorum]
MKSRFTSLDVTSVVKCLRDEILGLRVANIYDINGKTYLLKLARPDHKVFLLIESGIRIHTTDYAREKSTLPSVFTLKLRKHLRTKRVENVRQLGVDRVVEFTFGSGQYTQRLIVELYASGNVILTDEHYSIQTLLRTHKYEDDVLVATHQKYPMDNIKSYKTIEGDKLKSELNEAKTSTPTEKLKTVLNQKTDVGTLLVEHCILSIGLTTTSPISDLDDEKMVKLMDLLNQLEGFINPESSLVPKGYIYIKTEDNKKKVLNNDKGQKKKQKKEQMQKDKANQKGIHLDEKEKPAPEVEKEQAPFDKPIEGEKSEEKQEEKKKYYEDFQPMHYLQFDAKEREEHDTFCKAVDQFFSKVESQKSEQAAAAQEAQVLSKLDKVKIDQQRRVDELLRNEDLNRYKAQLIETNIDAVQQVINIVSSALATSMNWNELARVIKEEKKKGDPFACMIHKLNLEKEKITLVLTPRSLDEEDESEEALTAPSEAVDIDVNQTAHANSREYYDAKKKSAQKAQKTLDAASVAIKAAEKKTMSQLKEVKTKNKITAIRKPYWFEKFNWFITTQNYLVISGKDMQQNEMLYKKYMKKGDIYVHADIHGAATCIIKNPTGEEIPPPSLIQAGHYSVCRSAAWNEKIVTNAYWVYHHQVSKSAPSGEYLTTGSFMIRGKKNFLPPSPLIMGLGFMFKLHESCLAKHLHERSAAASNDKDIVMSESEAEDVEVQVSDDDNVEEEKKADAAPSKKEEKREVREEKGEKEEKEEGFKASLGFGVSKDFDEDSLLNSDEEDKKEGDEHKAKITAKERKLMKKGMTLEQARENITKQQSEQPVQTEKVEENKASQSNAPLPRGKRTKMKRIKDKYDSEDEEDRKLSMQLLGTKEVDLNPKEKKAVNTKGGKGKESGKGGKGEKGKQEGKKQQNKPQGEKKVEEKKEEYKVEKTEEEKTEGEKTEEKEVKEGEETSTEGKEGKNRAEERRERRRQKEEEQKEIDAILEEESVQELGDEEKDKLSEIDSLTSSPLADDVLLFAIPVCAPYSAMSNYKYKVKLQPGNVKRGKAGKTAVSVFSHMAGGTSLEKDLIKYVPETEITGQLMGSVKISTPGLMSITKQAKQKRKTDGKNK